LKWDSKPLAEVADFCLGKMLDEKKNKGEFLPYLANVNVRWGEFDLENLREMRFKHNEMDRYGVKQGDIVMCEGGEPGRCAIWKEQIPGMMIQKAIHRIRPYDFLDHRFLFYQFLHKGRAGEFSPLFTGATIKHLPRQQLAKVLIKFPRIEIQRGIADILSAYDDLIENNRRRMVLLEDAARQLYREWFVRLRFPGHEHIHIHTVDGVPHGWQQRTLGEVMENFDRNRVPISILERDHRRGSFPYYGAAGILDYIDGYLFDGRYLLMGEDGTVITASGTPMLQLVEGKFWVNNHAHVLRGTLLSTEHIFCALSEYQIQGHVTGVAQPKITQKNMNRIPILVPPQSLCREFGGLVDPLLNQRFTLAAQIELLLKARDLLLPRLMSGDIEV
jgi:type I restriction enzyme S subunit